MQIEILKGDCLETLQKLDDKSINTCITSPPYWGLRDYGNDEQLGLEETPIQYVENLVKVFREVKRVLRDDGTVWLNLGDSYNTTQAGNKKWGSGVGANKHYEKGSIPKKRNKAIGLKQKDLVGIPWRVALALQQDGWYLRQDIIWHKPNPMPESVKDRCTKAHEYIFLLSKSHKYYFDNEAIKEDAVSGKDLGILRSKKNTNDKYVSAHAQSIQDRKELGIDSRKAGTGKRNKRSVWTVTTKPFKGAHFATFPMDLIEPCVLAGCPRGGTVLDPFAGSGTTGIVAVNNDRNACLLELSDEYIEIAKDRIKQQTTKNYEIKEGRTSK